MNCAWNFHCEKWGRFAAFYHGNYSSLPSDQSYVAFPNHPLDHNALFLSLVNMDQSLWLYGVTEDGADLCIEAVVSVTGPTLGSFPC